jgi:hypothetical protein
MLPKKNGYEILKEIFGEKIYIINWF